MLCACGDQGQGTVFPPGVPVETSRSTEADINDSQESTLPAISHLRNVSEPVSTIQFGSEFWLGSANAVVDGNDLLLPQSGTAWAVWCLPFSGDDAYSLELLATGSAGPGINLAVADFEAGRWKFEGPHSAGKRFQLDVESQLSPGGKFYIAAVCPDGSNATVRRVILDYDRPRWQVVTIGLDGSDSYPSSLEVVDGHPAIAFGDYNAGELKYVRSLSPTGEEPADWSEVITVDNTKDTGKWASLEVINGAPAISYQQNDEGQLYYIFSVTTDGVAAGDWSDPVIVDDNLSVGGWSSLREVSGNPAICYYDFANQRLKYARSTSADGAQSIFWSQKVVIDDTPSAGTACRLEVVDGHPAIAYHVLTDGVLRYVRSSSTDGALPGDWEGIITIDDEPNSGTYISLAIVSGNPAISCYSQADDGLKYFHSSSATGGEAADWTTSVVFPLAGLHTSLSVVGGQPAICFNEPLSGNLQYIRAGSGPGSALADWSTPETVEEAGDTGHRCSMKVVDGKPAVTYVDAGTGEVKYAIRL